MTRTIAAIALLALCWISTSSASSQEAAVENTVDDLLEALGRHDVDRVSSYLADGAVLIVARMRNGKSTNTVETGEKWLDRMRSETNPQPFEERLSNAEITIDNGELAYLRADFEIVRDGKVVSYGVDVFTLMRRGEEWKVASIAYTNLLK